MNPSLHDNASFAAPAAHLGTPAIRLRKPWYERSEPPTLTTEQYERVKRLIDIVVALALLPAVLVILGLLCMLIRLDSPGPAMFAQLRTGRGGQRFKMLKLRTMLRNAEELKSAYAHLNELSPPDFKIPNDPRITRVGWILRKTSLDELPQLLNVLRGDMSLVGPRPTSFTASTYALWHTARLELKPGITGTWQVSGRSELGFDERVRLDIAYLRNRCLWLDLQILARTVLCVLTTRGAK